MTSIFGQGEPIHGSVPPFLIRAARPQDLADLADVLAHSFHAQDGMMGWLYPLLRLGIQEDLRSRLRSKSPHQVCLVAVNGMPDTGRIIGTVELARRMYPLWHISSDRFLYLSNLAVQTDYRHQGAAYQLLLTCEQLALEWGFNDLYLHVLENNHPARKLYLKAGYRLQQVESRLGTWLWRQPRQLFLHKRIAPKHPPTDLP